MTAAAGARLALVVVSAFVGYLIVEVGYRVFVYYDTRSTLIASTLRQFPVSGGGTSIFDVRTGYRYRPNIEIRPEDSPFPVHWRTNAHGHIARGEYPVAKPEDEFRIGLVGDSFTANVTNSVRWGDVLEDGLNASAEWAEIVGGLRTKVINFGLDGIGVVQFDDVVELMALPFELDLLIVNLLGTDVARRSYFRGSRAAGSAEEIVRRIDEEVLTVLPGVRPTPRCSRSPSAGTWV